MEGSGSRLSQRSIHRCPHRGAARTTATTGIRPLCSWRIVTRFSHCRKECLAALAHRSAGDRSASGEVLRPNANTVRQDRSGLHGNRRGRDASGSNRNAGDARNSLHRNQRFEKRATDPRPDRQTIPSIVSRAENPYVTRFPAFPPSRLPAFPPPSLPASPPPRRST
jgi:hypothetical protein